MQSAKSVGPQLLGLLIEKSYCEAFPDEPKGAYPILSNIHRAKFRGVVIPGDRMELVGELGTLDRKLANGKVRALVDGEIRAEAGFSFFLIQVKNITNERLIHQRAEYADFLINGLDLESLKAR